MSKITHIYEFEKILYPSVTTVLSAMMPEAPALQKWRDNNKDWEKKLNNSAVIGTIAHHRILNSLSANNLELPNIDWSDIPADATKRVDMCEIMFNELSLNLGYPRRVEKFAANKQFRVAGKIDLECSLDGVYTLIDLKTSREFRRSHDLQCGGYHLLRDRIFEQALLVSIHPNEKGNAHLRASTKLIQRDKLDEYADEFLVMLEGFHAKGLTKKLHDEHGTTGND